MNRRSSIINAAATRDVTIVSFASRTTMRTRSGPSVHHAGTTFANYDRVVYNFMRSNPMSSMFPNANAGASAFRVCAEPACTISSRVAEFDAMTMRTGLSYCLKHVKVSEIRERNETKPTITNKTLIFYDIELSRDGEIEQLGACAQSNVDFSAIIRTSVRSNSSPFLRQIPAKTWNVLAEEPRSAMMRFNAWIMATHAKISNGDADPSNVMLAAHYGSCHDHVHVLKAMMKWGMSPPNYSLVDTLAIFKVMKGATEPAKLSALVTKYAPWVDHTAHDANSDADALRIVSTIAFGDTKAACFAFSITSAEFMARSGLSMYSPTPTTTTTYTTTNPRTSETTTEMADANAFSVASSF